jgi:putative transposase
MGQAPVWQLLQVHSRDTWQLFQWRQRVLPAPGWNASYPSSNFPIPDWQRLCSSDIVTGPYSGTRNDVHMPRRPRRCSSQFVFHVINRAVEGVVLFRSQEEYQCFLGILVEGLRRFPVRLLAYVLMPNHWHLVVWPNTDEALSDLMKWVTATHAQTWRRTNGSVGRGSVYQGRFKAIAVQHDGHFLRLCHYVERNALRAHLVARAEEWPWTSASPEARLPRRPALSAWPVPCPRDWIARLNLPEVADEMEAVRRSVRASTHYGSADWRLLVSARLGQLETRLSEP